MAGREREERAAGRGGGAAPEIGVPPPLGRCRGRASLPNFPADKAAPLRGRPARLSSRPRRRAARGEQARAPKNGAERRRRLRPRPCGCPAVPLGDGARGASREAARGGTGRGEEGEGSCGRRNAARGAAGRLVRAAGHGRKLTGGGSCVPQRSASLPASKAPSSELGVLCSSPGTFFEEEITNGQEEQTERPELDKS